jgi:hypothetical protein
VLIRSTLAPARQIVALRRAHRDSLLNLHGYFQRHSAVFHRSHRQIRITTAAGESGNFGVTALPK